MFKARRCKQSKGEDFRDTYVTTVSGSCWWLLSTIVWGLDFDLCPSKQTKSLFKLILLRVFCRDYSSDMVDCLVSKVVRLNKSLYGFKPALGMWHANLTMCLKRLSYKQCLAKVYDLRKVEGECVAEKAHQSTRVP